MPERRDNERRKVNQAVGKDHRGKAQDRRRCPDCGSSVRQASETALGGTVTRRYCTKCGWQKRFRQVDEHHLQALAGFEIQVQGTGKKAVLDLPKDFLKAADLKLGDTVELKALYTPGSTELLRWILKKL